MTRILRNVSCRLALASLVIFVSVATAQVNPNLYAGLKWRNVGPFHGGRISSVTGVIGSNASQNGVFYVGTPLGGIWKTTSGGVTWFPVTDSETSFDSVGAVQVAPSSPDVVYAGTGDPIQGSLGNGMWKSVDAGKTWQHVGLEDTVKIDSILVDPADPNLVTVSALGDSTHKGGGIHRSTDGGKTWTKVFDPAGYDGIRDLQFAFDMPGVMIAATQGSAAVIGGGGGARVRGPVKPAQVFKSTDKGVTWTQIKIPPFQGRIALAIAQNTKAQRMYIVGNNIENGSGLYRSDDGGTSWKHMAGKDTRISNGQGAYSSGVFVDSQNPDVLYTMSTAMYRSTDGGVTFQPFKGAPGGEDYHKLWVDPTNGSRMLVGSDQGASVTLDNGRTWSLWYTEVISQVYHVATDNRYPYHIMGAQQDTGAVMIDSRGMWGQVAFTDWSPVPSSEFGVVTPDPRNPDIIYGVGYGAGGGGSGMTKIDMSTGQWQNVAPNFGADTAKYPAGRDFQKKFDLAFEPGALYVAYQCLLVTRNGAHSFTPASPDLTTAKGEHQRACGAPHPPAPAEDVPPPTPGMFSPEPPMDLGQRGANGDPTIADFSISRVKRGVIWSVSSNGQIFNTIDSGKTWNNVSNLPDVPARTVFNTIVAGGDVNTAYLSGRIAVGPAAGVNASDSANATPTSLDVDIPLIWRTTDGGKTWASIVTGLPSDERTGSWVNSLRADPEQRGLLFAGTETTVYVSFDNGDHWQSLRQNLPSTSVRDLEVHTTNHQNNLVIGTYGRGFWVLDDIVPLREIAAKAQTISSSSAYLFQPEEAIRARSNSNWDQPTSIEVPHAANVPYGAMVDYYLSHEPSAPIQLQVFDDRGKLVRTISSTPQPPIEGQLYPRYWLAAPESRALSTHVGMNRINWNLFYDDPPALRHDLENQMNMTEGATTPGPHGPQVIPGIYTLKLTVDGQVYTSHVTVVNDPRAGQSVGLMAGLRSQNKLTALSVEGMQESFAGYTEVDAIRGQLASLMQSNPPADVAAQAKTLNATLTKVGGVLPAGGGGGARRGPPDPTAAQSFMDLNNSFNTMVSMMQVGLDMPPTPTQISTWESDCRNYNRTLTDWKSTLQKISDFNAGLAKNNLQQLTIAPTKLSNSTCTFVPESSTKSNK